ncbi:hypothetical protein [Clostridium beijerinckii]|uniref:Uncharacterized protein n=1 Tax=Clostridium beijerinckii TaxID=1520 RepID=A0A9Q5D551_CLOBE|nr:hypothetical protein [Clostridium beijerinckii]AQS04014.1 hypothetical protein CLBIJ_14290 [Clostridium beijerinckii]MBA2884103.1 hypothetical protein [Clostridium beijerinckii]MBA2899286.1 hypothetical protein [Clostridium beijerinckii]MBA2908688.1 hypothetical protein [Clostridium beijerinckii]MBA9016440.1 hypothetical protein [Clostridium beijerinckii]
MTIDDLEEFIDEKYDIEFANDKIYGEWITIEQGLESSYKALKELELKDSWDEIKKEIKFLEKYKGNNYQMKYALNGIWSQGWVVCKIENDDYKFVDFYRTI